MKAEMDALEARKGELASVLANAQKIRRPPANRLGDLREEGAALTEALNRSDERQEAAEALRVLIEKIVLTPGQRRGKNRCNVPWIKQHTLNYGPDS